MKSMNILAVLAFATVTNYAVADEPTMDVEKETLKGGRISCPLIGSLHTFTKVLPPKGDRHRSLHLSIVFDPKDFGKPKSYVVHSESGPSELVCEYKTHNNTIVHIRQLIK